MNVTWHRLLSLGIGDRIGTSSSYLLLSWENTPVMNVCQVSATPGTSSHPSCAVDHARAVCTAALADLAATDLDGGDLRSRPDYWVGQLQFLLGYLLVVLDEADRSW